MTGARAITASVTAQETSTRAATTRPCLIRSRLTLQLCAQCEPSGPWAVTLSANPHNRVAATHPAAGQRPAIEPPARGAWSAGQLQPTTRAAAPAGYAANAAVPEASNPALTGRTPGMSPEHAQLPGRPCGLLSSSCRYGSIWRISLGRLPMQPEVVAPEWMFCCAARIAVTAPAQQAAGPTVIMLAVQQRPLRKGRLLDPVATAAADCLRPPCLSPGLISASVGGRVRRPGSLWSDSRVTFLRAPFAGGIVGFSTARFEGADRLCRCG